MNRPTKEQVDAVLGRHDDGFQVNFEQQGWLAAEVRELREDYAQAKSLAEVAHAKRLEAEATINRVEALPAKWRAESEPFWVETAEYCVPRDLADDLEAALKGEG